MLDDSGPRVKLGPQLRRLRDGTESAIENQVALIGSEWRAIVLLSHGDASAQGCEEASLGVPPKRDDLDRQRPMGAKNQRQLPLIDDDDLPATGLGHDFLV